MPHEAAAAAAETAQVPSSKPQTPPTRPLPPTPTTTRAPQLWAAYLSERRLAVRGARPDHPARASLRNTYERALVSMHKMPRVWLDYLELLLEGGAVTRTRRAFDRALAALPITQHDRVWVLYLVRVYLCGVVVWCGVVWGVPLGSVCV